MAEAALSIVWGRAIPGREKQALDVFDESLQWWTGLQQDGKIEHFDVAVLAPSGGDVGGFILARGTGEQIDSLRRSKEYQQQLARVMLVASNLRVADSYVDEGLAELMGQYREVIDKEA